MKHYDNVNSQYQYESWCKKYAKKADPGYFGDFPHNWILCRMSKREQNKG